jgi:putative ABC transport system ATP-binding protein
VIELRHIYKDYYIGDSVVHALNDVSLSIGDGAFVGVVGPSGSGKSTLMNILGILDTADCGEYLLDNTSVADMSDSELAQLRNRNIGFVFQNFNLIGRMSIAENVELPLIYQGVKLAKRRLMVKEALEKVGLSERGHHTPNSISGGQQQRAAIARALVTRPSLILADEPTGNLDSATGTEIMQLLHELNAAGSTIVLITHDHNIAAQTGHLLHIMDGKLSDGGAGGHGVSGDGAGGHGVSGHGAAIKNGDACGRGAGDGAAIKNGDVSGAGGHGVSGADAGGRGAGGADADDSASTNNEQKDGRQ